MQGLDEGGAAGSRVSRQALTLAKGERARIQRALEKTGGRVFGSNGAAKILDINPKTLHSRMKKPGIRDLSPVELFLRAP